MHKKHKHYRRAGVIDRHQHCWHFSTATLYSAILSGNSCGKTSAWSGSQQMTVQKTRTFTDRKGLLHGELCSPAILQPMRATFWHWRQQQMPYWSLLLAYICRWRQHTYVQNLQWLHIPNCRWSHGFKGIRGTGEKCDVISAEEVLQYQATNKPTDCSIQKMLLLLQRRSCRRILLQQHLVLQYLKLDIPRLGDLLRTTLKEMVAYLMQAGTNILYLTTVFEKHNKQILQSLCGEKVAVIANKATDVCGRNVVNILAHPLDAFEPSKFKLLLVSRVFSSSGYSVC